MTVIVTADLRFCHPLTGQRKCPYHEGRYVEPKRTSQTFRAELRFGIPGSHRPGRRGARGVPAPCSPAAGGLSPRWCHRTGPRQPWPPSPQCYPVRRGCRRGGTGHRPLRRRQPHPPHRTAQRTRRHRPEPAHGAPHSRQGGHRQSAESALAAAPFSSPADAPGGDAAATRRQPSRLVGGPRYQIRPAAGGGRRHQRRGQRRGISENTAGTSRYWRA